MREEYCSWIWMANQKQREGRIAQFLFCICLLLVVQMWVLDPWLVLSTSINSPQKTGTNCNKICEILV